MGIQIYIKKESLKREGINVKYDEKVHNYGCRCGKCLEGVCPDCGTPGEIYREQIAEVSGLDRVMGVIDNAVYHDANHWGSSRKPILEFIEKHKLKAGEDWYEA